MKNKISFILCFVFISMSTFAQQTIDGSFDFQFASNKKYSIYIPSGYDENVPHQLMLGLHPLNVVRWNSQSWRDTLINFAEINDLLLVCPDGGPDGRIDDAIDTSFTSALLDSVSLWYNIDEDEKYIMGFSWGGKTTYSYGLRRTKEFAGFMPIGAAVNGLSEVANIIGNAKDENFYLVHGSQDAAAVRFTELLNGLNDNEACVDSRLLSGIGHTIDFPNRDDVLTKAFNFLKNNNCNSTSTDDLLTNANIKIIPNPNAGEFMIEGFDKLKFNQISMYNLQGKQVAFKMNGNKISLDIETPGLYFLVGFKNDSTKLIQKILINK
ncbi:MAG: T9SS type A sorting domain-containing protein [Saprospiraceae bacterium]|nr:T9SS type A sorting domain-containing protein [Saprospiraceae bacterium]